MYTFNSRVRYSETDESGRLTVTGMINYMQDCSTFHSEDVGVGVGYLGRSRKIWLLSSWQIVIKRYPKLGDRLEIGTWHNDFKGIYGYRNFVIRDEAGEDLVQAASVWFLYDLEKEQPARVTGEDTDPYGEPGARLELGKIPRKIPVPAEYETMDAVVVSRHHLDTNHHVNNAQYVDMAREAVPGEVTIREIRADYRKAALLGDLVIPRVTSGSDGSYTVALCSETGDIYAVVWLMTETADHSNEKRK